MRVRCREVGRWQEKDTETDKLKGERGGKMERARKRERHMQFTSSTNNLQEHKAIFMGHLLNAQQQIGHWGKELT